MRLKTVLGTLLRRPEWTWAALSLCLAGLIGPSPAHAAPRLPLVSVSPAIPGGPLVVFYSGDGGWAHTDRVLSSQLGALGLPVVGLDALHYFWRTRAPDAAASDLTDIIRGYSGRWSRRDIVLAGYSFGADALPLIVPRLPPDILARVQLVALIAPGDRGELVLRPRSWLNISGPNAKPIAPALAAGPHLDVLCVYGARDRRAACPRLGASVTTLRVPGGHHMAGQEPVIARAIASAAQGR